MLAESLCIFIALKFGVWRFIKEKTKYAWESLHKTFEQRKDALVPAPLRGLWRLLIVGDRKVRFLYFFLISVTCFSFNFLKMGALFLLEILYPKKFIFILLCFFFCVCACVYERVSKSLSSF